MATVRCLINQAIANTDDETAQRLVESGQWEMADAHKKRAAKKTAEADNEE